MIFGPCPYCEVPLFGLIVDGVKWERTTCDSCCGTVWRFHSRVMPLAYSEEGFREEFDVDELTKEVSFKTLELKQAFDSRYLAQAKGLGLAVNTC